MIYSYLGFIISFFFLTSSEVSAFTPHSTPPTYISPPSFLNAETEFGKISEELPPLDQNWVVAAQKPLPWESDTLSSNEYAETASWSNGQYWYFSRTSLVDLWILPTDMSKGSWENYANAASKAEEKVLNLVPQLFRLSPTNVIDSAKTVLDELKLPPALLRKEPILLAMDSERLWGGFETIRQTTSSPIEVCRDTPGLFAKTCIEWMPSDDTRPKKDDSENKNKERGISSVNNIQLLQKSFDNEVSADDLHMKPFLQDDNDDE